MLGVCSTGARDLYFTNPSLTRVLPVTRAGAIFQAGMDIGKFHGVMIETTPRGFLMLSLIHI